jgi:hypothetical protein
MSGYQIFRERQYQQFYITDGSKELKVLCSGDGDLPEARELL